MKTDREFSGNGHGVFFLAPAFLIWGISPVYWKSLADVPSMELLLHRIVWSFLALLVIVMCQGRLGEITRVIQKPGLILSLFGSTAVLALNWYLFIWAVNHDQVLQTSLGYYINPLIMVFLGMVFLKERLRPLQTIALVLAGCAVSYYTLGLGRFPWIALSIALSFGFYGLFHKLTPVAALPGLCLETLILSVPSVLWLTRLWITGEGALFHDGPGKDLLLFGTCLVTALPLLLYTIGTRLSRLSTVGFMQYIAPSCTFVLAVVVYREGFSLEKGITFVLIWTALFLYSCDALYWYRKVRPGQLNPDASDSR